MKMRLSAEGSKLGFDRLLGARSRSKPTTKQFKIETDEKGLGTIYIGANIEFWIRDQMGRPVHFKVENRAGVEPASWTARYKTAIESLETSGGWSRYLNPVLNLPRTGRPRPSRISLAHEMCRRSLAEKRNAADASRGNVSSPLYTLVRFRQLV